jgi:hypothetical protein
MTLPLGLVEKRSEAIQPGEECDMRHFKKTVDSVIALVSPFIHGHAKQRAGQTYSFSKRHRTLFQNCFLG